MSNRNVPLASKSAAVCPWAVGPRPEDLYASLAFPVQFGESYVKQLRETLFFFKSWVDLQLVCNKRDLLAYLIPKCV